jgi:hypothetical protein
MSSRQEAARRVVMKGELGKRKRRREKEVVNQDRTKQKR